MPESGRTSGWIYATLPLVGTGFGAAVVGGWQGFLLWFLGVVAALVAVRARELLR